MSYRLLVFSEIDILLHLKEWAFLQDMRKDTKKSRQRLARLFLLSFLKLLDVFLLQSRKVFFVLLHAGFDEVCYQMADRNSRH